MIRDEFKKRIEYIAMCSGGASQQESELLTAYDEQAAEIERLRAYIEVGEQLVREGVALMPLEQLSKWIGVRAWQEQDIDAYKEGDA